MATNETTDWTAYLSPLRLVLLAVNGVCLGACLVLLALGLGNALLTVGVGLSFGAGAFGAYRAIQQGKAPTHPEASRSTATGRK